MSLLAWCSRRVGGLSMIAIIALSYWVITSESVVERHGYTFEHPESKTAGYTSPTTTTGAGIWTSIFVYYCVLVHLAIATFPLRACWAVWDITQTLSRTTRNSLRNLKSRPMHRRGSYASVSSSETLISSEPQTAAPSTATSSEAGDFEPEMYTDGGDISKGASVTHAIIIPNYKEELDTLKETLEVLASHPQAHNCYDVYLGMEQREQNGEAKALGLVQNFAKKFRSIDYVVHPSDIPGEAAGKGSNIGWAARKLSAKYGENRKNVIVTGIDADSHLASSYFAQLTDMHLNHPDTASTTLYAAPIIFDRNAHSVPAIVRIADILWSAGGMSGLYRGSAIAPPTSVYSLSLELIDRVGGWDTDAEAIGEDLHMYVKCFFALNGNITNRTILSPVSQSNVAGGGKGGLRGLYVDMQARYKQALRHMWGALDSGFALRKTVEMWQNRKQTTRAFRPLHQSAGDNFDTYFPESQLGPQTPDSPRESGIFSDVTQEDMPEPHLENLFYMAHRLFEAHIMPVHMTVLVLASTIFLWATEGKEELASLRWVIGWCGPIRAVGFIAVACYIVMYERYHTICVTTREKEMKEAGLYEGMCFSYRSFKTNWTDYAMIPLVAPLYGSIPCIQAEITHFWTIDLVYTVSKKVTRQRARSIHDAAAAMA
ncbi:uncharacterized protein F5Z01DRAFT_432474 [Emericellopsis atlantica]|uniref:Glycosyltransferase 2-like domain-containing protein n=1 Tax=Emericellopsis atlantica TaxID=2614577 RepID=A0A9P7ZD93_9HYPO|nr:uncharacterized protein F5Z01DRAFT_432474 [Emericellopsis atlantica]KAG9250013.1 hypothetical protein F5Z01DRAFT_432474 [Emericellopsis atlantica]